MFTLQSSKTFFHVFYYLFTCPPAIEVHFVAPWKYELSSTSHNQSISCRPFWRRPFININLLDIYLVFGRKNIFENFLNIWNRVTCVKHVWLKSFHVGLVNFSQNLEKSNIQETKSIMLMCSNKSRSISLDFWDLRFIMEPSLSQRIFMYHVWINY